MAKRARGSSIRPGQRVRLQRSSAPARPASSPAAGTPKPVSLTEEEEARAAALEAQIVADEKAAEAATRSRRERSRREPEAEPVVRAGSIAVRASQEYAYVARDLRRVATIGGGLIALLLVLYVVIAVTGIGPF